MHFTDVLSNNEMSAHRQQNEGTDTYIHTCGEIFNRQTFAKQWIVGLSTSVMSLKVFQYSSLRFLQFWEVTLIAKHKEKCLSNIKETFPHLTSLQILA